MGAEIAKISLWLASFVPGLALSYLDHNVRVGNSLIGVADVEQVEDFAGDLLRETMAKQAAAERSGSRRNPGPDDRTRSEASKELELRRWSRASAARRASELDIWTVAGGPSSGTAATRFHWPLEFPEVFEGGRGFDAVVGNPPWEEVTVEELAFYARYQPGLRGAARRRTRLEALDRLQARARPELAERASAASSSRLAALRALLRGDTGYVGGAGDPDLYKFFCQRYRRLLASGGTLAVVLPRSAFGAKGSTDFRRWLFEGSTVERLDFLLNNRRWMFDTHPQYTVALVVATAASPPAGPPARGRRRRRLRCGVRRAVSCGMGLALASTALGPLLEVPLLPSQAAADLLAKLRSGGPFPLGCGRWRCFPVAGAPRDERSSALGGGDRRVGRSGRDESFDQYDPHGAEERPCPASPEALAKQREAQPRQGVARSPTPFRRSTERPPSRRRSSTRASPSATSRNRRTREPSSPRLVPPETFLTNKAPYLDLRWR